MRLLHLVVIGTLILAASYVYKIKFDATLQAERVAKLRGEIRRERDATAVLRAEWARLDTPARIQLLVKRHLPLLQPIEARQFGSLDKLPEKPARAAPADPIGDALASESITSSIGAPR